MVIDDIGILGCSNFHNDITTLPEILVGRFNQFGLMPFNVDLNKVCPISNRGEGMYFYWKRSISP